MNHFNTLNKKMRLEGFSELQGLVSLMDYIESTLLHTDLDIPKHM